MHRHTFVHATHFSRFIPLSLPAILLWIWYFLISTRSRLCFVTSLFLLFRRVSFQPLVSPALPPLFSLQPHSFLPYPSLLCQSSSHSFVFISCSSLWSTFSPFCFTALLRLVSAPLLHYYFLASFFHFVFSHGLHCTFSTPSIFSIHTATRAPRWIFILCVSYLHRTSLGLKWLKSSISYPERFKHTYSE